MDYLPVYTWPLGSERDEVTIWGKMFSDPKYIPGD